MKEEKNLFLIVLKYYYEFYKIDIRAESYIISLNWIARQKATINPKNEKDNVFNGQ